MKEAISTSVTTVLLSGEWERTLKYKCIEKRLGKVTRKAPFRGVISKECKGYIIPGLGIANVAGKGCVHMVPQGICVVEDYVLISAYCYTKEHASVFYVLKASNMEYECTLLTPEKAHLGGIAYDGRKYLWACISNHGQQKMHGYDMSRLAQWVEKAKQNPNRTADLFWEATCDVDTIPSFCTFFEGFLWVGTFTKNKESIAIGYKVDGARLEKTFSMKIPSNAQGMTFYKNWNGEVHCAISASWGRKMHSKIYTYRIENYGKQKPIDEGRTMDILLIEEKTISMPSMMEGIYTHGLSVYAIFESAARKYRNGDGKGKSIYPCDRICEFAVEYLFE